MNTSANALLSACYNLVWDGTDIQYTQLDNLGFKFRGVNNNLAQACSISEEVFLKINVEVTNIVKEIRNNIESFAEASRVNEAQSLNTLNQVNEQAEAILSQLNSGVEKNKTVERVVHLEPKSN